MKKKITAMILSLSLIMAMAPMAVFAEGGAADPADLFKVEAQDISETSVKLEWNWDNEKLPEELRINVPASSYNNRTFLIFYAAYKIAADKGKFVSELWN